MAASTTVLPPPLTCTASRHHLWQRLFLLRSRPTVGRSLVVRPEPGGESAGCVCLQLPCSAGCVCLLAILPAMPTALLNSCPRQVCFAQFICFVGLCPCSVPCAPGSLSSLLGPAVCELRELSRWQLQHGPAVAARAPVHF